MITRLLQIATRSKGLQQSAAMIIGNTLATGLSAISLIIISRLLGPSLFGEFSFGFALIMIIVRLNGAGLTSALTKFAGQTLNAKMQNTYFAITLRAKLFISIFLLGFGIFFYKQLNQLFNLKYDQVILISFVFGMSTVYLEQLTAMLQSLQKFNQAIVGNFMQAIVKLIGALVFLNTQTRNVVSIFGLYAIAPIVPLFFFKKFLPNKTRISIKSKNKKARKELFSMAKHAGVANISTTLVSQTSILFTQTYLTSYETGILGGVSKIQMLFTLIAVSLGNVLFPRVSRYKTIEDRSKYVQKSFTIVILSAIGFLISIMLAKTLILFTIGPDYLPGLSVLRVLLAAVFTMIATTPFTALFYTFNKNIFFSISGLTQVVIVLVGNTLLIPKLGLLGTAYTQLITRVVLFLITAIWGIFLYKKQRKN